LSGGYGGLDGLIGGASVAKEEVPGVGALGGELAGNSDMGGVAFEGVDGVYRFGASGGWDRIAPKIGRGFEVLSGRLGLIGEIIF
jgi:hypothetical protein